MERNALLVWHQGIKNPNIFNLSFLPNLCIAWFYTLNGEFFMVDVDKDTKEVKDVLKLDLQHNEMYLLTVHNDNKEYIDECKLEVVNNVWRNK